MPEIVLVHDIILAGREPSPLPEVLLGAIFEVLAASDAFCLQAASISVVLAAAASAPQALLRQGGRHHPDCMCFLAVGISQGMVHVP